MYLARIVRIILIDFVVGKLDFLSLFRTQFGGQSIDSFSERGRLLIAQFPSDRVA